MSKTLKATFDGNVFRPDETVKYLYGAKGGS
jgi:hypothetical protein